MGLGSDVGKEAAKTIADGIERAQDKLDHETLPEAQQILLNVITKATEAIQTAVYTASAALTDTFNRLDGASVPFDVTFELTARLHGKVGDVVLNKNMAHDGDAGVAQKVEVPG